MDKERLKSFVKNVDAQLFEIVNNLICSICQELFNKPVTTPCGHSFCSGCIKRVLAAKNNSGCPLCKNPVKRYGLEADEVKSKFGEICKELPSAFEQDVKDLSKGLLELEEELIKSSKLSQLYNQECVKESKTTKQKPTTVKKAKKPVQSVQSENDSGSFCPVLKRAKNVVEYASAKKKRMEDLVSISQTEPASNSSLYESVEVKKKLEKIEKIPPEEKIHDWFTAAGDNIYINSPCFSILEVNSKNGSDSEKREEKQTMIRRDYNKSGVSSKKMAEAAVVAKDPYEFVPSQNSRPVKKKRQKRATGRKLADFEALQRFSKESVQRNSILLDTSREDVEVEEEEKGTPMRNRPTASQKFEQLLQETREDPKKTHVLYSASQSSSPQFLDVSFTSKRESTETRKRSKAVRRRNCEEDILFQNLESVRGGRRGRGGARAKRKRSSDGVGRGKRQKVSEEVEGEGDEASEGEKSVERSLEDRKTSFPPTKLEELLKELLDDDIIYATRPANAPVRLPEIVPPERQQPGVIVTQNTELIGFCTQDECPNEKTFKRVVENLEKELSSNELLDRDQTPKEDSPSPAVELQIPKEDSPSPAVELQTLKDDGPSPVIELQTLGIETSVGADENGNCEAEVWKAVGVEFLHLGKLTPLKRRAKSTVVKVVFPLGLSSLARRRGAQTGNVSSGQVVRKQTRQVSTGIQTTQQQPESCLVQTSEVQQSSATMQTSQEGRASVEIQTTQKCNPSAEVQTSQRLVCQEIQTTQIGYESAQVQTSLPRLSQTVQTSLPKPLRQHRKIIKRKESVDADSPLPPGAPEERLPPEREVLMDFDVDEELLKTWQNTQKHSQLVVVKNQKNKERSEGLSSRISVDSEESDLHPPKRRTSVRLFSQDSVGILEEYGTRQFIPLDVQKVAQEEEMEVINLDTPKSQDSEEQMLRVLQNIDMDLPKGKQVPRNEKSEESDSDFFVEQTPPRPLSRPADDTRSLSKPRIRGLTQKQPSQDNLDDLIGDSLPKGFSESFLLVSAPPKDPPPSEKQPQDEQQKTDLKIQPTIDLPDENDQNQINAFEDRSKAVQVKAVVDAWRRSDPPSSTKAPPHRKLRIVASSVRKPDAIGKFATRFKGEYLSKPTKDMTHLVVGLHENDDNELLPLCTPKLLFAMANRKWVVSESWAESCLKANRILPEESFEVLDPVGGSGCKRARISTEKLFKNFEVFLLGEFQMISKEEFAGLIIDCGGTLVSAPENFSFLPSKLRLIIADRDCLRMSERQLQDLHLKHSTVILSRDVIIMSIQSFRLINFSPYLLHPASEEALVRLGYPLALVRSDEEGTSDSAR